MRKIFNPEAPQGADIETRFVDRSDEKRDEHDMVINAKEVGLKAGTYITVDDKVADYMLRTWAFLQDVTDNEDSVPGLEAAEEMKKPEHKEIVKPDLAPEEKKHNHSYESLEKLTYSELKVLHKEVFGKNVRVGLKKEEIINLFINK